jgi:Surface-adhesin protein E
MHNTVARPVCDTEAMRIVLYLLFLLPMAAAAREWVEISGDAESVFYFDRDSLKRDGDVVEVLLLWNFPEVQLTRRPVKPYLSATRLTRYDCKAGGRANVESTLYRGAMASGEVTEIYRTPDAEIRFEWVNPQAPGGESMRRVCAAASN